MTGSLATITGLGVTVTDPSGTHIVATASGLSTERAAVLLEIDRRNGAWKARNISTGWDTGFPAPLTVVDVVDETMST